MTATRQPGKRGRKASVLRDLSCPAVKPGRRLVDSRQRIAAIMVLPGRPFENAELDNEPQKDAEIDEGAEPAQSVGFLRRAREAPGLEQAGGQRGDQAVKGGFSGPVAVLEAFRAHGVG